MTPLAHMRLVYLPLFLLGLYLGSRILIPGRLGIVIGLAIIAIGVMWAVLTVRRSRSQERTDNGRLGSARAVRR